VYDFLNVPIQCLNHHSPLAAADEESLRIKLRGLLFHFEGEQAFTVSAEAIDQIFDRLNVPRPAVEVAGHDSNLKLKYVLDLDRLRVEQLSPGQLRGLFWHASALGASRVLLHAARAIRAREELANEGNLQISAMYALLSLESSVEQRLAICTPLEQALADAKAPVGRVIMQKVNLLHQLGRAEEGQQVLSEAFAKYPEDPYLVNFLQYAMQNRGRMPAEAMGEPELELGGGPLPTGASPTEAAPGSGLVLPGQETSSKSGESKLWLPGS
jgi:hypothetical protein